MKKNHKFIHLRSRSAFSLSEGAILINDLIDLCKKNKMPALSLTDDGNLFGALEFATKAIKEGIQPIIGCIIELEELNSTKNRNDYNKNNISKVLLLVENKIGWRNLSHLVSKSFLDSKETIQRPIKMKELFKNSEGLLCLFGGAYGPLGKYILDNKDSLAIELAKNFKKYFKNNLFIEIMRHGLEEEYKTEEKFINISSKLDIPLVATNNIYFSNKNVFEAHDCLMCVSQSTTVSNNNRLRLNEEHYFKNQEEMLNLFNDLPEAINNTIKIAKKCLFMPEERPPSLPIYPLTNSKNEHELLIELSGIGLKKRLESQNNKSKQKLEIYTKRLSYELDVIKKTGFSGYFLIVSEFVGWAKKSNIPVGPGRGSGAGCLVAWSLEITDLDPIQFGLLFERFLNPERISMPDFDIDFCPNKRDEVIKHVQEVYGEDKVAQIITFGSLKTKAVLRDVGRVLEIPFGKVDNLCKLIPFDPSNPTNPYSLQEAIDNEPRLKSAQKVDEEVEQLFRISSKLEGLYKNASTHAAGVVIGDKSLTEILPLYKDPKSSLPATQYDMKSTELSGLVKFDFLGLKTLSIIDMATSILKESSPNFTLDQISLEDEKVYNLISSGATVGIFQLEGAGVTDVLKKLRPDHFEDLIAVLALYRPGPMDNIPSFIRRKHKKEEIEVLHPLLSDILKETYGIMIYQEQVMESAQKLAGYSLGQADILRRAMGKKIDSEMQAQREVFVKGSKNNNINENIAFKIFDIIARFAGYGFNKSHAAAYAIIAYQTAWFKTHHPEIFMASLMTYDSDSTEKLNIFRNDLLKLQIGLLGPDVNKSEYNFTVEKNQKDKLLVRTGLCSISNVGKGIMGQIIQEREKNGLYKNILDFASRMTEMQFGKSHFEYLSLSGCFDSICPNRNLIFQSADILANCSNSASLDKFSKQESLFAENTDLNEIWKLPEVNDWGKDEKLEKEKGSLGFYFSFHPMDKYKDILKILNIKNSGDINNISNMIFYSAGIVSQSNERNSSHGRFARVQISDFKGIYEVTAYSELFALKNHLLNSRDILLFQLSLVEDSSGSKNMVAKDFWILDNKLNELIEGYVIQLDVTADIKTVKNILINNNMNKNNIKKKIKFLVPVDNNSEAVINTFEKISIDFSVIDKLKNVKGIKEVSPLISDSL